MSAVPEANFKPLRFWLGGCGSIIAAFALVHFVGDCATTWQDTALLVGQGGAYIHAGYQLAKSGVGR